METIFKSLLLVLCTLFCAVVSADDIVRVNIGESELDKRAKFKREVLSTALEATKEQFGPYDVVSEHSYMNAKRAFMELILGGKINAYIAITNPAWEELTIPIKIPVRCGMISYRMLVINKRNEKIFRSITNLQELKNLRVGLDDGWTTYTVMKEEGFSIVEVGSYDSMFNMLAAGRFDYLVRGVNEVYDELEARKHIHKNLIIEPTLGIYLPSKTYIFVSKKSPRLAQRLETGLKAMKADGKLNQICDKYFAKSFKKADFANRRVFEIDPDPDPDASSPHLQ